MNVRWWRFRLDDLYDIPFNDIQAALNELENRLSAGKLRESSPKLYAVTPQEIVDLDDRKAHKLFRQRINGASPVPKDVSTEPPKVQMRTPPRVTILALQWERNRSWIVALAAGLLGSAFWNIAFG